MPTPSRSAGGLSWVGSGLLVAVRETWAWSAGNAMARLIRSAPAAVACMLFRIVPVLCMMPALLQGLKPLRLASFGRLKPCPDTTRRFGIHRTLLKCACVRRLLSAVVEPRPFKSPTCPFKKPYLLACCCSRVVCSMRACSCSYPVRAKPLVRGACTVGRMSPVIGGGS